jgi:hypothetical protein
MDLLPHLARAPTIPEIGEVLLLAPPETPWAHEGWCRHLIRRSLIVLEGLRWSRADREARRLIANGRSQAGVRMPRGWDENRWPGRWPDCRICDKAFPPSRRSEYCSPECARRGGQIATLRLVFTRCQKCGAIIEDPRSGKKFCSAACHDSERPAKHHHKHRQREFERRRERRRAERVEADLDAPRLCARPACQKPLPIGATLRQTHCSSYCTKMAHRERRRANGHTNGFDHGQAHAPTAPAQPSPAGGAGGDRSDQFGG